MNRRMMIVTMAFVLAAPGLRGRRRQGRGAGRSEEGRAGRARRRHQGAAPAKKAVESAAGYAAFSNFGMKILVAGGGSGKGIAVNNKTKATTYMKMAEVQAGLGFGVKKFRLVWVFETEKAFNDFVNSGWEIGAQATASAKAGDKGAELPGRGRGLARRLALPALR